MCEDFRRWFTCGCLLKSHSLASRSSEKSGWSQVGLRASFLLLLHCAGCTGNIGLGAVWGTNIDKEAAHI